VSEGIAIDAKTRWEAMALLRVLEKSKPWTVQLRFDRWVVYGRPESFEEAEMALGLVAAWAGERGLDSVVDQAGEALLRLHAGREAVL
jgi:hypothetical protein